MFHKNPKDRSRPRQQHGLVLTEDDLLEQLALKKGSHLLLGVYTTEQIEALCERSGLFPALRKQGLSDFIIDIEPLEEFNQSLKIYSRTKDSDHLLGELRLREVKIQPPPELARFAGPAAIKMLAMDWLMMQNPFHTFAKGRLRLPGQEHPGLGQARKVLQILLMFCRLRRLAGLLNFPEFFHNAAIYHYAFQFYSPECEALLTSLLRDLAPLELAEISWAIEWSCVRDAATNTVFEWQSGSQILPVLPDLKKYLQSDHYLDDVQDWCARQKFILDTKRFQKMWLREFEEEKHV